jgi:hypothetical protein
MRLAIVLALGLLLALASPAGATDLTVNDPGDAGDMTANDEICDSAATGGLQCTLRAATEEANSDTTAADDTDRIGFAGAIQGTTLSIGSQLDVSQPVTINGCTSVGSTSDAATAPCVGVRSNPGPPALNIPLFSVLADDVFVRGLALTNASAGLSFGSGSGLRVENTRFGIRRDGAPEGNTRGLDGFGQAGVIGGDEPRERNVFGNHDDQAVHIVGTDNWQISGNYFGTAPDGTTAAPNGANIVVSTNFNSSVAPDNTVIGATVSAAAAATAECDGGCNVIANANGGQSGGDGINLAGFGTGFGPAGQTTVKGNFIGIDKTGTTAAGNQDPINDSSGVKVNRAQPVTVGGPNPGDRNYIGANDYGVSALGFDATNLTVQNNFLGIGSDGTTPIPDNFQGVVYQGNGPATIDDNRFGGNGTLPANGMSIEGNGTVVTGNSLGEVFGPGGRAFAESAIRISGTTGNNVIGGAGAGDGNVIGNADNGADPGVAPGIDIDGPANNTIQGNLIGTNSGGSNIGNEGPGIRITDNDGDNKTGNIIGGSGPANVISNNGGAAVEVLQGAFSNLIAGNTGLANGGPFIDLQPPVGVGNNAGTGANQGVQPPTILTTTGTSTSGTAGGGATVHLYSTDALAGTVPTGLTGLLGTASADGGGAWSIPSHPQLPPGQRVTATQTQAVNNPPTGGLFGFRNTSEHSPAVSPGTGGGNGGGGAGGGQTGGGQTTGQQTGSSTPAAAAILASLRGELGGIRRLLERTGIRRLLRGRGVTFRDLDALLAGKMTFAATGNTSGASRAKRVTVLRGSTSFSRAGKAKLKLKLTRAGRRLLRRARRARLSLSLAFTDRSGKRTPAKATAKLRRR